jgi:hypothetical protein
MFSSTDGGATWGPPSGDLTPTGAAAGSDMSAALGAGGTPFVAWYYNGTGHKGVYAAKIDRSSGARVGSPVGMPGTSNLLNGPLGGRTPIVARPGGGVYSADGHALDGGQERWCREHAIGSRVGVLVGSVGIRQDAGVRQAIEYKGDRLAQHRRRPVSERRHRVMEPRWRWPDGPS